MTNINTIDRFLRALLGIAALQLAYFWLAGGAQMGAYLVGAILLGTAAVRFCPLYRVIGINKSLAAASASAKAPGKPTMIVGWVLLVAVLVGGSYASNFFSRKLFLEDFNAMNDHYKQTLFLTGKNEREKANTKYDLLVPAYQQFQAKYATYRPYALRGDGQLGADLASVAKIIADVNSQVRTGDLHQAHLDLEKVRPVFQDMFKRNGFSMLAVALVDFHDAMELMLDAANAKDAAKLVALYPPVSDKLKAVEGEANDTEIQLIRKHLDELLALAKEPKPEQLAAKADLLKSSFVKVYLKRG